MKKLWHIVLCVVLALTLVCGFAACGGDSGGNEDNNQNNNQNNNDDNKEENQGGDETETVLTVPQGVRLDGDMLVWTGVENAAGYTVKINADETTNVTSTSLDLTTVTTKLVEGSNTLAVKAKGTGNYRDSAYSTAVSYVYTAPETTSDAAKAFVEKVNGIGTLAQTNTQAEAAAISTAISEAEAAYEALSAEDKTAAAGAKASLDMKKQAYTEQTEGASTAHSAFAAYLLAAEEEMKKEASAATLEEKIEAVKTAKGKLSTLAGGLVTSEETEKIAALETTLQSWKTAIAAAVEKLSGTLTELAPEDDATAEAVLTEVAAMLEGYDTYKGYIKSDTNVAAKLKTLNDANMAAQAQIKATVDALKAEIDEALTSETEATLENYNAFIALQSRAAALGVYGKELFGDYKKNDLASAVETILATPVSSEKYETLLSNHQSSQNEYMIVCTFVNVLEEPLPMDETQTLHVGASIVYTKDGTAGQTQTLDPTVSYEREAVIVTIPFDRLSGEDTAALTYIIGKDAEKTVTIGAPTSNFYFAAGGDKTENRAYGENGNLITNGGTADQTLYFDIYDAADIDLAEGFADKDLKISGKPLFARVEKDEISTYTMLRFYLASHGLLDSQRVVLVGYQAWEIDGVNYYSRVNTASVSEVLELDLTREDLRLQVKGLKKDAEGNQTWSLGEGSTIDYEWAVIRDKTLWNEVYINVYNVEGHDVQSDDFLADDPFAEFSFDKDAYVSWSSIDEIITQAWKDVPYADRKLEYTFVFAMQVKPNDAAKELGYIESALVYAAKDGQRQTKQYNFVRQIKDVPLDRGVYGGEGHIFTLVGTPSETFLSQFNRLIDGYVLTADNAADYLEILIEVVLNDAQDQVAFSTVVPFQSRAYGFDRLTSEWAKQYFSVADAEDNKEFNFVIYYSVQIKEKVGDTDSENLLAEYFLKTDRAEVNAESNDNYDCRTYTMKKSDVTASNSPQVNFPENAYLQFLRGISTPGAVFTEYHADYIELKITNAQGESEIAYILLAPDENVEMTKVILSANREGTGATLNLNGVTDSNCTQGDFNRWVNETFGWTDYSVTDTQCKLNTRVVVSEGSQWLYDGDWSDDVVAPTAE